MKGLNSMQISLFCDFNLYLKSSPFYTKFDATFLAIEQIYASLSHRKKFGRKGYDELSYIKALIYKKMQDIKSIPELIRDLESRPVLCDMMGFKPYQLPDSSRFYVFLAKINNSKLEEFHHAINKKLLSQKIISLDLLIADSKPVMANTKHNNPKNPSRSLDKSKKIKRNPMATFNYFSYIKQPTSNKKTFSYFWGYRTHVIVSKEGIPLIEITKPNSCTDANVAKSLLKKLKRVYGQKKGRIFIADAAYDIKDMYNFVVKEMKGQAFIPINPRNEKPEKLVGANGNPLCEANLEMKFAGTCKEKHRIRKKFWCPIKYASRKEKNIVPEQCPCNNPKFNTGKCYGCTAYIDITDDARSQVPRQSKFYENTYKNRTEVERYFSRMGDREAEQTTHFCYRSIRNQMTIAHISLSLVAYASAIILKQPDKIRCFKSFANVA